MQLKAWLLLLLTSGALAKILEESEKPTNKLIKQLDVMHSLTTALRHEMMHKAGSPEQDRRKVVIILQTVGRVELENVALSSETLQGIRNTTNHLKVGLKKLLASFDRQKQPHETVDVLLDIEERLIVILLDIEDELDIPTQQAIKNQVDRLVSEGEKQRRKDLPKLVVHAIFSNDLQEAAKVFKQVDDRDIKSAITFIVKRVYGNNLINAQLLENFADHVNEVERKYETYQALYNELLFNNHISVDKFVNYANKLRAEVLDHSGTTREVEGGAKDLINKLDESILTASHDVLKNSIREKSYDGEEFQKLYSLLQSKGSLFAQGVYLKVVEEMLNEAPRQDLLSFARSLTYLGQQVVVTERIYRHMKETPGDDPALIKVGFVIREIMEEPNYPNIQESHKKKLNDIKEELPLALKNAAFANKICIKNTEYNEYLYSPGDNWQQDEDRRHVFTWVPGKKVYTGGWQVVRFGDQYHIRNTERDEYLYGAVDGLTKYRGKRAVFTWQPHGTVINGRWSIEVDGDNCYLKEVGHNQYLYAGNNIYKWDTDRRMVFIHIGRHKHKGSTWRIEDCT